MQGQLIGTGQTSKEQPAMSVAEVICDQLNEMRCTVQSATRRVRAVADTLKGQEPSPINKEPSDAGHIMARTVAACHDEVQGELAELNRQIDRPGRPQPSRAPGVARPRRGGGRPCVISGREGHPVGTGSETECGAIYGQMAEAG
jgi:hypothetical protein